MIRIRNFALAALLLTLVAGSLSAQVYINEYCNDPLGAVGLDCNADGTAATSTSQSDDEFVEIVNAGPGMVNIGGWTLNDGFGLRHTFAAGTQLPAGAAIVVFGGGSVTNFNTLGGGTGVLASTGSLGLNNGGDTIFLYDAGLALIDTYAYTTSGPDDGDGESITRATDNPGDVMTMHTLVTPGVFHSAGFKNDGTTAWLPAVVAPPVLPTYPGNNSDFDVEVRVNGTPDNNPTRVISVNANDVINLWYMSPGSTTELQPFSAFYQLFFTGTALTSQVIPGETPPGGFWLDTAGTNPGAVTGIVPFIDGIGFGGPTFLTPILPTFGYNFAFPIPPIVGGQGFSLMLQAVIVDPGLNGANLGIDDCVELQIN